jgi:hypothetical protein
VLSVEPFIDDIGQSNVYIEDLWISPADETEAIEQIVRMYLNAGIVMKLGVEKVGQTTTHLNVARALKERGRRIEFTETYDRDSTGVLLRPAGRNKFKLIESAIAWPLKNGKIFYSKSIPGAHLNRLIMEMQNYPAWHNDGLNMIAYLWDIIRDYHFEPLEEQITPEEKKRYEQKQAQGSWMSV